MTSEPMNRLLALLVSGWEIRFKPSKGLFIHNNTAEMRAKQSTVKALMRRGFLERTGHPGNFKYRVTQAGVDHHDKS